MQQFGMSRAEAWEQALADCLIEGLEPSAAMLADVQAHIEGRITGDEFLALGLARARAIEAAAGATALVA